MLSRKVCTNIQTATYSGRECSPLHFGLSAEGYDIGTVMDGFDKVKWCVRVKNNRRVWVRYTTDMKKMTYEEPIGASTDPVEETKEECVELVKKEDKKITDYNLFLTYRLSELKRDNTDKKNNKELFAIVIAEWKELKKNKEDMAKTMEKAHEFHSSSKKM